jgi:hypothetical protein
VEILKILMERILKIDSGQWGGNEDVADEIMSMIRKEGFEPESFLYRGLNCTNKKLRLICRNGTDRNYREWKSIAMRIFEKDEVQAELGYEEICHRTNPEYIWASPVKNLATDVLESVGPKDIGIVLAYDSSRLTRKEAMTYLWYYKFVGNPNEALKFIFKLK